MISTTNIEQAKNLIKKEKQKGIKPIIVQAQNDEFNRKILEYGHFDILLSPEAGKRERNLRNIDSGFNEVLGKIATKNNIAIGIDMQELSSLSKEEKAKRLERIIQNIKIAKKTKTKIVLLNYKDRKDAIAFMISLGSSTKQAKQSLDF